MTTKHSFLPPSGAAQWSKCALWPTMNARYPEANTTASEEGTAAHWVLSELMQWDCAPAEGSLTPNGLVVTDEMIDGALMVREVVEKRMSSLALHIEETVNIPQINPECFGTPDIFGGTLAHLEIVDYKFGNGFVDEYWNPQGLLYMLGIMVRTNCVPITVSFTIVQPRCFYRGEPVRTHTYKTIDATDHIRPLLVAAERAYAQQPTATTGPQCEHCPGRHACPTLQLAAGRDAETSTDQQPVDLTPQAAALELHTLDKALTRLTARVEGLRELTTANLKAGAHVPHYKLENGRGRLAWTITPEEVAKKLGKKAKLLKVITPTQAKKLLLDDKIIAKYTDIIPGGLRLVESSNSEASRVFKKET